MKARYILPLLAMFIAGCAGQVNEVMASWVDCHSSELITKWGPPNRTMDDGAGGQLFIYEFGRSSTGPGYASTQAYGSRYSTVYYPPQTSGYVATRTFWVNSEGIIYRWAWKGI